MCRSLNHCWAKLLDGIGATADLEPGPPRCDEQPITAKSMITRQTGCLFTKLLLRTRAGRKDSSALVLASNLGPEWDRRRWFGEAIIDRRQRCADWRSVMKAI